MRDSMKPCHHTVSEDAVYKEVVVIGNGPSGMVTSFMLSGNVPYLKEPIPEDLPIDEMLRARLSNLPHGQSLYETDLMALAEGLEGRSQNPIPLLMDNLLRPCADLGVQADSLIDWRYDVEKKIDHIVLGRGPPGGAWHTFPPAVKTLSPGAWLSLPPHGAVGAGRVPARSVAAYCRRYVKQCQLQRYFRNGVIVTGVTLAPPCSGEPCRSSTCPLNARWCVTGYDKTSGHGFRYWCSRVVLASGGADRPNTLGTALPGAVHSLADIERAVRALEQRKQSDPTSNPVVLVIGSGVSAADAVCLARSRGLTVALAHRDPAPALTALNSTQYPEYHQVYKMMCDGDSVKYDNYIPYPEHVILKVKPEKSNNDVIKHSPEDTDIEDAICPRRVKLLNVVTNEIVDITVSLIAVLIGSKPDLFFLHTNFDLNCIDFPDKGICSSCTEQKHASKRKIEDDSKCFLKNHWHYIKSVLGQSIQSCKSRYLNTEINGNNETKCIVPDCNQNDEIKCLCNNVDSKENLINKQECECQIIPYSNAVMSKIKCQCKEENPYSSGLGFGIDPKKPVDCRGNPIAVDKSNHELLNAPKGMFALGPLTADNFIRFIPGGALAIVSYIHKEMKFAE